MKTITVFEHETVRFDIGEKRITELQFQALQKYFGEGKPYFQLCNNGVRFNEYVGVIQVGNTVIEILPKADKQEDDKSKWRDLLIGMLKAVGSFDIKATSNSNLKIQPNTILDLYFELFINEVEYLLHNGLIKRYRKKEGNVHSLKGSLQFSKNIQKNLVHQERFYVRHTTYDVDHQLHQILYKTILLLKQINTNAKLQSRIGALLLNFPEMKDIKVIESTFERIVYTRKNASYRKSIEIAKLLLLQYHPDLSKGRNHILALMFDMNLLWEQFVYRTLRKNRRDNFQVRSQYVKYFWKPLNGKRSFIKPDIVLTKSNQTIILDTKWKNLNGYNPSPDDLRQMFVYHKYFNANKVALVYPGSDSSIIKGNYLDSERGIRPEIECSVILLQTNKIIKDWQNNINKEIVSWINTP